MKQILFAWMLCFCSAVIIQAQVTPVVSSSKSKILIGEPLKVTFEIKAIERNAAVKWNFPDSLSHFEYVSFDTASLLKREITVTSWDSGEWKLEGVTVTVPSNVNSKQQLLQFASEPIKVEYDTTGSAILNDIKPIIEVENAGEQWIAYTIAAVTFLCLLWLIYLFRKWKAKKKQSVVFESAAGAYEEFATSLAQLKTKKFNTQEEQKELFTQLSFIAKRYLERNFHQPFSKYTTDETAFHLAPTVSRDDASLFIQMLRLADVVKFAKFTAPAYDCTAAINNTETVINHIHQQGKE
jgi:hypothetical protein